MFVQTLSCPDSVSAHVSKVLLHVDVGRNIICVIWFLACTYLSKMGSLKIVGCTKILHVHVSYCFVIRTNAL